MNDIDKNLMKDHNYDGIYELDNDLPFWWVALFIITVIIGIVYCSYYFLDLGPGQEGEYAAEVKRAERIEKEKQILAMVNSKGEENPVENAAPVKLPDPTAENISAGKAIFEKNCFACHAMNGSGLVGPNLTDHFFIHGPTMSDIVTIITKGNPAKGMVAWSPQLSEQQIFDVASFVHSLIGQNLKGKGPEGKEYKD